MYRILTYQLNMMKAHPHVVKDTLNFRFLMNLWTQQQLKRANIDIKLPYIYNMSVEYLSKSMESKQNISKNH